MNKNSVHYQRLYLPRRIAIEQERATNSTITCFVAAFASFFCGYVGGDFFSFSATVFALIAFGASLVTFEHRRTLFHLRAKLDEITPE